MVPLLKRRHTPCKAKLALPSEPRAAPFGFQFSVGFAVIFDRIN